ncbi:MAG: PstS family phosphate ABC transporter substrate-binding protein [Isosphaeraceae bacterium]|nr:PstS family phosphate ABC transporter substrate-binding protein [Isosphaeraceae bacterium]
MLMMPFARFVLIGILLLGAILPGCGGREKRGASGAPVIIDGSSTVYRISLAAQEAYDEVKPGARIVVDYHGTGGGFGRYLRGEVDIVDASREAKPEEESQAQEKGFDWTRFTVGYDGITIVVNPKNTFVESLSVEQLKRLWQPDSPAKTWKDLDPSWPDRKIVLYSPDDDSGTYEFFTEAIIGKAKSQRKDVQLSADDNVLVTGVSGDIDGLGYFGYAYYAANAEKLRAVPIRKDAEAEPVRPSPETILDGSYQPLSRPLYIYVKNAALKRPEVMDFVQFYLDHVSDLAQTAGYVPPTDQDRAANRKALDAVRGAGTK